MIRGNRVLCSCVCIVGLTVTALAQRSPTQRSHRSGHSNTRATGSHCGGGDIARAAVFPTELRTIDGHGNNQQHPEWGAAEVALVRSVLAAYADDIGSPAGRNRPSARAISNAIAAQSQSTPNPQGASDYVWQWGQFLDHDITEVPIADPAEAFDVPVPAGDIWFDRPVRAR